MISAVNHALAAAVREHGVGAVGVLPPAQLADVRAFLKPLPVWAAHVKAKSDGQAMTVEGAALWGSPYACYDLPAAVLCPHLLEAALALAPTAGWLLQADPVLYSMNIWWSFSGQFGSEPMTRGWHVDEDDERSLAVFFWLTDVLRPEDGAQQVRMGPSAGDPTETVLGPAGFYFVTNPRLPHRSLPPEGRPRLAAWARYGVSCPPPVYYRDQLMIVSDPSRADRLTAEQKHVARFLLIAGKLREARA